MMHGGPSYDHRTKRRRFPSATGIYRWDMNSIPMRDLTFFYFYIFFCKSVGFPRRDGESGPSPYIIIYRQRARWCLATNPYPSEERRLVKIKIKKKNRTSACNAHSCFISEMTEVAEEEKKRVGR